MTLDIEGMLAGHRANYHQRNVGGETAATLRYTSCEGCDWLGGWHDEAGWEAHVAAVLREQIAAAQAEAAQRVVDAVEALLDEAEIGWTLPRDVTYSLRQVARRAAQVAPSRVPGEGS
jgi:hypothetical protein